MAIKFTQTIDFGAQRLQNLGSPSVDTDAATKGYVDAAAQGLDWKASVRAASTGNLTIASPGATIDGVAMATGDRFLAKDQATGAENGLYVWNGAAAAATRAPDANTNVNLTTGAAVSVEEGSVNAGKMYLLITAEPITVGTTALTFTQLGGSSTSYNAGNGLSLTGTTFAVVAGTGIVSGANVGIDTNVVARKYAANIGNGSLTTITVTHNLGTRDVDVRVYNNATPWDDIYCEVQRTDANNVALIFGSAPATNAYRVVVQG